ncbi:titin-like [Cimex lectularius]|uniref:Protein stoned-B n=1 Tax=Cimex lectularius TaxID=79782 RepID=A0A8I6RES0_CIMLE|nr:titin-like [Cimex lectularius]
MLKIPKGLKKKKKGKKSKHKEEDLFDSAELEQYRKEQQQKLEQGGCEPAEGNDENSEEWQKFKALTSGVDDILKKTQGDLDRIKSTSFFQKKPPGPSTPAPTESVAVASKAEREPAKGKWVGFEEGGDEPSEEASAVNPEEAEAAFGDEEKLEEEEEEESEFEDGQDDIFDTSYVDVVTSGEVKLAYVPDSPEKEEDGFDPFDTSIVDKVIKVDPNEEKKKKLVSLGCAVEVLTGKLEKATAGPPVEAVKTVRRRPKPQDLLLGSFDEGGGGVDTEAQPEPPPKSLLDEDPIFEEETQVVLGLPSVTPLAENKSITLQPVIEKPEEKVKVDLHELVEEFIPSFGEVKTVQFVDPSAEAVDELDDEFAALAAESLSKQLPGENKLSKPPRPELPKVPVDELENDFDIEDDPFDTTFASQVLPGKFELKLIEKEILENPAPEVNKIVIDSRIQEALNNSERKGSVTFKTAFDEDAEFDTLRPLESKHRDLLGGSTTDLSKIVQNPIVPASVKEDIDEFSDIDPFDTSVVDKIVVPGKSELRFLEKELLEESKPTVQVDFDDDFDPRADEKKPIVRPDNLTVGPKRFSVPKVVAFDVKSPPKLPDLLAVDQEETNKVGKPLTPYYPPPGGESIAHTEEQNDPFDTSHVKNCPGRIELKLIEKELVAKETPAALPARQHSLSDDEFDPRSGTKPATPKQQDIISGDVDNHTKLHTPVIPKKVSEDFEDSTDFDPFDTSIASVLVPGKAEIKILETELIYSKEDPVNPVNPNAITEALIRKSSQSSSSPRLSVSDVLENTEDLAVKPLTPVVASSSSFDLDDSVDPFDTSGIGDIVGPGKTELKILESELIIRNNTIMANPFLFTEDIGSSQVSNSAASFNPFLSGGNAEETTIPDNPFMSSYNAPETNVYDSNSGTNPFAFSSEPTTTSDFFGSNTDQTVEINYENIFASSQVPPPSSGIDIFSNANVPSELPQSKPIQDDFLTSTTPTNDIFAQNISGSEALEDADSGKGPPRRPPPPKPGPPKETKDLILSVTGAMEATSSSLLDRLQATRTPSPTPMRDLHSPSPTHFGDLLEVDEPMHPMAHSQPQEMNLLGDFDIEPSGPIAEPTVQEKRPSVDNQLTPITPVAPPAEVVQPLTPMPVVASAPKPASPAAPFVAAAPAMPPSRPAPPSVPQRPKLPPQPARPPPPPARVPTPEPVLDIKSPPQEIKKAEEVDNIFGDMAVTNGVTSVHTTEPDDVFSESEPHEHGDFFSQEPRTQQSENINDVSFPPVETQESELDFTIKASQPASEPSYNIFDAAPPLEADETFPAQLSQTIEPLNTSARIENAFDMGALTESVAAFSAQPELFAAPVDAFSAAPMDAFSAVPVATSIDTFSAAPPSSDAFGSAPTEDFDAFTAKFERAGFGEFGQPKSSDPFDPFSSQFPGGNTADESCTGFGADDNFDSFLSLREPPPVPQGTPARVSRGESAESVDDNEFNIFIKPKAADAFGEMVDNGPVPSLAPPPKSPSQMNAFQDTSPRFNPFDSNQEAPASATENIFAQAISAVEDRPMTRTDSQETPPTPLFDEDMSQPLENFPRIHYDGPGWEMQLRQPNKKKITGQRFWKKIFIKLVYQGENPVLQLFNGKDDKDPFQELPLQPCYSVSDIAAQQYDQYGKIFTVKLQFIFYKERPGVRPGQVTKAERITNKLSQFAAYAIQGDYQGVKEFGSDLKKLGLPVEHAPQISQLFKIGSQCYEDMKQFSMCVEEALFRLSAHRDRALTYKMEEVQITAVDELYVEQNANGGVEKQIARVRLFFLGFLSGMPDVELGVNDLVRQGKEVVGRHDIIPVVTEEWIRLENVEFHSCVQLDEYERTRTIKFKPPDACYIELMRFRVRPPKNRELPLQLKTTICVTGNKV